MRTVLEVENMSTPTRNDSKAAYLHSLYGDMSFAALSCINTRQEHGKLSNTAPTGTVSFAVS